MDRAKIEKEGHFDLLQNFIDQLENKLGEQATPVLHLEVAGLLEVTSTTWTQLETTSQRYQSLIPDSALGDLQQEVKELGQARLKFIRIKHLAEAFVKAKTPTVTTNTSTGRRADIQIPELKVITFFRQAHRLAQFLEQF
jgi:hypothetical protein